MTARNRRIPYLVILTSASQLYSGVGTALFEWIRYAKSSFDFAICIDNGIALNHGIARDFCSAEGLQFLPSAPAARPGAADTGVADAQLHAASGRWPVVEVISWASSATNLDVVDALCPESKLIFTPHTQPTWTIPGGVGRFWLIEPVFDRVLARSNLVCCVSPAEVETVQQRVPNCPAAYVPNGVDTGRFCPAAVGRERQILMIADFSEFRKRADLNLSAMARLAQRNPGFRAVIGGPGSDKVQAPPELAGKLDCLGYVPPALLLSLYRSSAVFLVLSDYEAFCVPIAESLACGTPAVTNSTEGIALALRWPGWLLLGSEYKCRIGRCRNRRGDSQ